MPLHDLSKSSIATCSYCKLFLTQLVLLGCAGMCWGLPGICWDLLGFARICWDSWDLLGSVGIAKVSCAQIWAKIAPRGSRDPKMGPRRPQDGPKIGPKWGHHGPRWAKMDQDGPMMAPRWFKMPQDRLKMGQRWARMGQDGAKTSTRWP